METNTTLVNQLPLRIQMAVADGEISLEEYDGILKLANQMGVTSAELDLMVQQEFRQQFKHTIANFATDGRINSNEMVALKQRAAKIGITEDDLQLLLTEALNNQAEETKNKVKKIFVSVGAVGTVIATGLSVLRMLTVPQSADSSKLTRPYKQVKAPRLERCKMCGKLMLTGRLVYRYQSQDYCSVTCVKEAINPQ